MNLHVSIIVFDAALTKFVKALANIARVVVDGGANLAQESRVFDGIEKLGADNLVVGFVKYARFSHGFEVVEVCRREVDDKKWFYLPTVAALMI